jgi:para-nitrobenzyl esterase
MSRIVAILTISCLVACATEPDALEASAALSLATADAVTQAGPVHGALAGDLAIFRGIPYAAPPIGARRFAPPAPPAPWTAPRTTTAFGPACPQRNATPQSEDCLSLNVWAHASGAPRAVIVWIHGGGYVEGTSASPQYDGAELARTGDVVVVSINYRLGLLGYLALPQLAAPDGGTGNWGLRDQIAALRWVRANIAAFGGDPAHVMIAGESAGGGSVCALLAAPAAQGLFASAAIQSGVCRVLERDRAVGTFPPAFGVGVVTALDLGCTTGDIAGCLRARPASAILATQGKLPTSSDLGFPVGVTLPIVDGVVLDQRPLPAIRAGRGNVSLIAGSNRDDASAFIAIPEQPGAFARYLVSVGQASHLLELLALYPPGQLGERGAAIAYATDVAFACSALAVTQIRPATSRRYQLDRPVGSGPLAPLGAVHGLDFVYLFGTFATWGIDPGPERALSTGIQQLWGSVARGRPEVWPAVPWSLHLDTAPSLDLAWRDNRCAALTQLGIVVE